MHRYSTQLSFAFLVLVFLTVTVGEGQAYSVQTPKLAAQLELQSNGFIGKPQIFAGETILTGEVQQNAVIIYTVEKGESVSSIAARYNLSVGTILDKNNIDPVKAEKITPGTELIIPAEDTNTSLAWLDTINKAKEEQRRRAEEERQKQLALQRRQQSSRTASRSSVSYSSGGYSVIGRMVGSYNGGYPGQCTWYVNYKRPDLPNGMGNGGQYLANARAKGLPTGSTPRVGAVIVTSESSYGHVGIVEAIHGSTMTISEMNFVASYTVSQRSNVPIDYASIKGYIY